MGQLLNPKHECFARAVAAGRNASQAYADSGFKPCRQNAHRMMTRDDIKQRVLEIQSQREIDTKNNRDAQTGQFLVGHKGNGGRPRGSRNRLTTEFIDALYSKWQKHGSDVLDRVIADDPAAFLRVVGQILPKELDVALTVKSDLFAEAQTFAQAYRLAREVIGADPSKMIELEASYANADLEQ